MRRRIYCIFQYLPLVNPRAMNRRVVLVNKLGRQEFPWKDRDQGSGFLWQLALGGTAPQLVDPFVAADDVECGLEVPTRLRAAMWHDQRNNAGIAHACLLVFGIDVLRSALHHTVLWPFRLFKCDFNPEAYRPFLVFARG